MIVFAALLAVVWLTASGRDAGRGVASGMTTPFTRLWTAFAERLGISIATWTGRGPDEHQRRMQAELARLKLAAAEEEELRRQNRELRAYYGLPPRKGWRVVLADVVARDPATWNRGFRINRGANDGVLPGCVVLAETSVIGRVTEVQPGSATVLTVGARGCRLSVVLEGSRITGILDGVGSGRWQQAPECIVDLLPRDTVVSAGELVWTSGLGGSVPGGLVVGRVASWPDGNGDGAVLDVVQGTHARVWVAPAASFRRLGFVAVYCPDALVGRP